MRVVLSSVLAFITISAGSAAAQSAEEQVQSAVQQALDGLVARDTASLRELFDPAATLVLVRSAPSDPSLVVIPTRDILQGLASPGPERREQIRNVRILTASDLATVVADYVFYYDDVLHHCGVTMYDLVQVQNRWRIIQIRQTVRREGCVS